MCPSRPKVPKVASVPDRAAMMAPDNGAISASARRQTQKILSGTDTILTSQNAAGLSQDATTSQKKTLLGA